MNFATNNTNTRLAFIDPSVPEYQTLISSIQPGTEVAILDPSRDGISQITETLANYQNIASIEIISHGAAGEVDFSSSKLNLSDLSSYTNQLQAWNQALAPHADILLYGCDVAATERGQYLIQQLAQLTGADVAASTDATGGTAVGGNWNLEYRTGDIEALGLLDTSALANYNHRLATLTVSNTNDSGAGSLRNQIANAAVGDTINFGITGTITLTTGELAIDKNLTIQGPGAGSLAISGNNASRVFNIGSTTASTVSIDALTIRNGSTNTFGGGIYVGGGSSLNLSNSTISANSASIGGGGIANSGTAITSNSTISANSASTGGGGIYNRNSATATTSNSTISANSAVYGGGIYNRGTLNTSNSAISANSASIGGGIYNRSTATTSNSTISANSAKYGGGIFNFDGTATTSNSTISANSAKFGGGGIVNKDGTVTTSSSTISGNSSKISGGGIVNEGGTLNTSNSTISGNSAAANGGGIVNGGGTLNTSNSTISGNSAGSLGGGIFNGGLSTCTLNISNSTISGNSAKYGGGIYSYAVNYYAKVTIGSSIVAANTVTFSEPEVSNKGSSFTSNGNNLVGQNGKAGGFPTIASDIVLAGAISTALAPLADNGGFKTGAPSSQQTIRTHALVTGSPAIDKGVANGLTTDERDTGFSRVSGVAADIGAFELQIPAPTLPDLTISKTVSSQIVNGGQAVTFTLIVSNIGQAAASGITVSDALPSGLTFVTATATGGFSTPSSTDSSGNLNFTGGSLAAGGSATLTVVVSTPSNLPPSGYSNTTTVDPLNTIAESNENNNTASANVGVIPISAAPPIGEPIPNNQPIIPPNPIPGGFVSGFFPDLPPGTFITPELQGNTVGQTINGTDGNDILIGGAGNDTIRGGRGDDTIYGYGGDNLLIGGRGNDFISGGKGNDTLIGTNTNNRGKGERDILTGNGGANLFVLGDAQSTYYDDGDSNSTGLNDYALITDFNLSQDAIQLKAGLNYLIGNSPAGLPSGAAIFIDNDGIPRLSANDELIGILQGVSTNNPSTITSRFQFV